jgi:hypothetical protein
VVSQEVMSDVYVLSVAIFNKIIHYADCTLESRLEKVNRRNLEFTHLNTNFDPRVIVRNNMKSIGVRDRCSSC